MATFIHKDNQQLGPLEDNQVLAGIRDRRFLPDDLAWREGMAAWQPLGSLFPATPLPPPLPPNLGASWPPNLGDNARMRMILPVGRSGWAIAAGYLGLFALIVLPAPLALIVSIIAIWDIRRSRGTARPKHGMGRAIFGLITGLLGTVVLVALLVSRRGM